MASNTPVGPETPISVKLTFRGYTKKFKIPLGQLTPGVLPSKLRSLLNDPEADKVTFERFSDSAGAYISLNPSNAPAYRTMYRAAKAKQKLRLRATLPAEDAVPVSLPADAAHNEVVANLNRKLHRLNLNPTASKSEATLVDPVVPRVASGGPSTLGLPVSGEGEAPVPQPFSAPYVPFVCGSAPLQVPGCTWSVYCNSCDTALPGDHWHCNVCDQGDYDLCQTCRNEGKHCKSESHWMIKRSVKNGQVVVSTTERVLPKSAAPAPAPAAPQPPKPVPVEDKTMPGAFAEERRPTPTLLPAPTRTCNSCVKEFDEDKFVTCLACDDFDLCMECHCGNKHGHHPAHAFKPAVADTTVRPLVDFLLAPGRNVRHAALCDNCDKHIYGVRHKCLNCPDWDYCSECVKNAPFTHPGHRFVPVYEPLPDSRTATARHVGIYCDGPLCHRKENVKEYITGVRYKCAICDDLDFCANCEASPKNRHNRTHPLIKFKTAVRNVSVTTMGEDVNGDLLKKMGDARVCPRLSNTVSQVKPIVDVKPAEESVTKPVEKIEIKDLLAEPIMEKVKVQNVLSPVSPIQNPAKKPVNAPTSELNAHFVRDTVTDGTKMIPNQRFMQTWTLKNPGPHAWPAGCSVRYVGGDNMLNVQQDSSAPGLAEAVSSSVVMREVQVGEEVSFKVVMKSPLREGTSISYWRLKSADGVPFGHRLWCHINVSSSADAQAPFLENAATVPPPMPQTDAEMLRLLEEMNRKRLAVTAAVRDTEMRVKQLQEQQKARQAAAAEDPDRARRVQMLRALHAARLAAVSAEKKEVAANMQPPRLSNEDRVLAALRHNAAVESSTRSSPPAPTVEDVPEKEEKPATLPELRPVAEPVAKSTMIFPKLEKESPSSSTHDVASNAGTAVTTTETVTTANNTEMPLSPGSERPDFFEDAESVEILDDSDSDDDAGGFLTDEEYDILDASDEELGL